jgi:cell division protein FtsL
MIGLEQNNVLVLPVLVALASVLTALVISLRSKTDAVQKDNLSLQRELMALQSKVDSQEMTIHALIDKCAGLNDDLPPSRGKPPRGKPRKPRSS